MPKCSMRNCKNTTSKTLKKDGISYFRFPRDPIRCGEWTSIVSQERRQDFFKPNSSNVVCSEHFLDKDMYVSAKGIKRLLKTAVPSVPDISAQDLEFIEIPDDGGDTEVCRTCSMSDVENKEVKSPNTSLSTSLILHIHTTEGSTTDTPRKVDITSELHKFRRRLISKDKLINNLRKKNSRLVKKTILLKNALKLLKKRFKD